MKNFCRMTKLTNISGRADYISANRQENFVCGSEPIDWTPYAEFEKANIKSDTPNNEGRELIIALPNEWAHLDEKSLKEKVQGLAELAVGKKSDMQWAVHWNKSKTNLHVHIIFSERTRTEETGVWDRDIYLTNDGKVARKKSDRAIDADGNVLPPLYRKGEKKLGGFSPKDEKYKQASWLQNLKNTLAERFKELGVNIEPYDLLHEYHEGVRLRKNSMEVDAIKAKNVRIRAINKAFKAFEKTNVLTDAERSHHRAAALESLRNGQLHVFKLPEKNKPQLTPPKKQPKPKPALPKLTVYEKINKLEDLQIKLIDLLDTHEERLEERNKMFTMPWTAKRLDKEIQQLRTQMIAISNELGDLGVKSNQSDWLDGIKELIGVEPFYRKGKIDGAIEKVRRELPPPARRASPPKTVKPPQKTMENKKSTIAKVRKEHETTSPPKPTRRIKKSKDERT